MVGVGPLVVAAFVVVVASSVVYNLHIVLSGLVYSSFVVEMSDGFFLWVDMEGDFSSGLGDGRVPWILVVKVIVIWIGVVVVRRHLRRDSLSGNVWILFPSVVSTDVALGIVGVPVVGVAVCVL